MANNDGPNIPARLASIEDEEVRAAVQALWLFETQKAQSRKSTYKDHYRTVLEQGALASASGDEA